VWSIGQIEEAGWTYFQPHFNFGLSLLSMDEDE
jgi:hypothetical protein